MCSKQKFESKESCLASIKAQKTKFKLYPYLCPFCPWPTWHKTKSRWVRRIGVMRG